MNQAAGGRAVLFLIACLALILVASNPHSAFAQGDDDRVRALSSSVVSEFPEGMRFFIEVEGDNEIEEISVRLKVGQNENAVYEYFEFDKAASVDD